MFPQINASDLTKVNLYDSKTKFKQYLLTYLEHYNEHKLNDWMDRIKKHDMSSAKFVNSLKINT